MLKFISNSYKGKYNEALEFVKTAAQLARNTHDKKPVNNLLNKSLKLLTEIVNESEAQYLDAIYLLARIEIEFKFDTGKFFDDLDIYDILIHYASIYDFGSAEYLAKAINDKLIDLNTENKIISVLQEAAEDNEYSYSIDYKYLLVSILKRKGDEKWKIYLKDAALYITEAQHEYGLVLKEEWKKCNDENEKSKYTKRILKLFQNSASKNYKPAIFELALFLYEINKIDDAYKVFDRIIDNDDADYLSQAFYYRGLIYLGDKQLNEALNDFIDCVNEGNDKFKAKALMKIVYLQDISPDLFEKLKSEKYYLPFLDQKENLKHADKLNSIEAAYRLGNIYLKEEEINLALSYFLKANQFKHIPSTFEIGVLISQDKISDEVVKKFNLKTAEEYFKEAAEKQYIPALFKLAEIFEKKNQKDKALQIYHQIRTHENVAIDEYAEANYRLYKNIKDSQKTLALYWLKNAVYLGHKLAYSEWDGFILSENIEKLNGSLIQAITDENLEEVRNCIRKGANPDYILAKSESLKTPIHIALTGKSFNILTVMLHQRNAITVKDLGKFLDECKKIDVDYESQAKNRRYINDYFNRIIGNEALGINNIFNEQHSRIQQLDSKVLELTLENINLKNAIMLITNEITVGQKSHNLLKQDFENYKATTQINFANFANMENRVNALEDKIKILDTKFSSLNQLLAPEQTCHKEQEEISKFQKLNIFYKSLWQSLDALVCASVVLKSGKISIADSTGEKVSHSIIDIANIAATAIPISVAGSILTGVITLVDKTATGIIDHFRKQRMKDVSSNLHSGFYDIIKITELTARKITYALTEQIISLANYKQIRKFSKLNTEKFRKFIVHNKEKLEKSQNLEDLVDKLVEGIMQTNPPGIWQVKNIKAYVSNNDTIKPVVDIVKLNIDNLQKKSGIKYTNNNKVTLFYYSNNKSICLPEKYLYIKEDKESNINAAFEQKSTTRVPPTHPEDMKDKRGTPLYSLSYNPN